MSPQLLCICCVLEIFYKMALDIHYKVIQFDYDGACAYYLQFFSLRTFYKASYIY